MITIYYVYMLRCKDESLYTGYTTDILHRFRVHQSGKGAKYTRSHIPKSLAYYETFSTLTAALQREAEIKRLSRKQKEALICNASDSLQSKIRKMQNILSL